MFAWTTSVSDETLFITQTAAEGNLFRVSVMETVVVVSDGSGGQSYPVEQNVSVNLLDTIDPPVDQTFSISSIEGETFKNLNVNAGDGKKSISLGASSNGNLQFTSGADQQILNASVSLSSANIDLGNGCDVINSSSLRVTGDLHISGSNESHPENIWAIGDVTFDTSQDDCENTALSLGQTTQIFGDLAMRMGDANNSVSLEPEVRGNVKYLGGNSLDNFTWLSNEAQAPSNLRIDLGGGPDEVTFSDNFTSNTQLLNYQGLNAFYDRTSGNVDIVQADDNGDVFVTNNGVISRIQLRVADESFATFAAANDLRVFMLDSTGDLHVDFDKPRNGNTLFQMRDGDRQLILDGTTNIFNGLLRIEAGSGDQDVLLADIAPLDVTGNLVVNTRDGNDTINASRALNVDGSAYLRGVNNIVIDNDLSIGGDFNVVTLTEDQDTLLGNNSSFSVGGNLHYLGGGGVDTISFQANGATIAGYTYIDIATSADLNTKQTVRLTGGYTTSSLFIDGGTAAAGNFFLSDDDLVVSEGMVVVNFAESTTSNRAIFQGNYGGSYGTYRGGSNVDLVEFGATANLMEFAMLSFAGGDYLTVMTTTSLDFLFADFGEGNDQLINHFGDQFPFDNRIKNL